MANGPGPMPRRSANTGRGHGGGRRRRQGLGKERGIRPDPNGFIFSQMQAIFRGKPRTPPTVMPPFSSGASELECMPEPRRDTERGSLPLEVFAPWVFTGEELVCHDRRDTAIFATQYTY